MRNVKWFKLLIHWLRLAVLPVVLLGLNAATLSAQMNGEGSITGSVTDTSGAYVPKATVTATNVATGVQTIRTTTSSGYYVLSPLDAGSYTVTVAATGFRTLTQENVRVDVEQVVGLNLTLQVGAVSQNVEVSTAPPELDTENATLSTTIENSLYMALPLEMSGGNLSPTAFMYLMPGVTEATGEPYGVFNGTGSYGAVGELYVDGVPTTRLAIQGDLRNVSDNISVFAVDQFQAVTAGSPVEYSGLGSQNYTIKSGTNSLHGSLFEYFRNTALDTWGWGAPAVINPLVGKAVKPIEQQNEFGLAAGGPIIKNKLFLFGLYDGFAYNHVSNPSYWTVPTTQEATQYNFNDLPSSQAIYDPATTVCNSAGQCSNSQLESNGVPNVIPPSRVSSIAAHMLAGFPAPTLSGVSDNYLVSAPQSSYAWKVNGKVDYVLNSKQRLSAVWTGNKNYPYGYVIQAIPTPLPWVSGQIAIPYTKNWIVEHNYVITPHVVNQLKWALVRYIDAIGNANYTPTGTWGAATEYGITGLPGGQTNDEFPMVSFSSPNGLSEWSDNGKAYEEVTNTYDLLDNVQYIHGNHSVILGVIHQWLQDNYTNYSTGNGPLTLNFSNHETGGFSAISGSSGGVLNTNSGDSFASYLLGEVDSASLSSTTAVTTYARIAPWAFYASDDYKVRPNLTVNLGMRWDFLPPYHEKQNRSSWLNPTMMNPAVNYPGALQFAGDGPDSCNCRTPIHTYYGDWGPRLGFSYSPIGKTVVRAGFAINYSHASGPNNYGREGLLAQGYTATPNPVSPSQGIAAFNLANGFPAYQAPPFLSASYGTSYSTNITTGAQGMYYGDPYLGSRAPYSINWNLGVERELTGALTISANYVANVAHFLNASASGARGQWTNQLNPTYYNLGTLLNATATPANIAKAAAIDPGIVLPYATFGTSGSATGTIAQMLRPFPQYNGITDVVGDIANSNYNALQLILTQHMSQGLQFLFNYTYSHEIDDQGTYRSGYYPTRAERGRGAEDTPQVVNGIAVYDLPFGRGHSLGSHNFLVRQLVSDWQSSGIFTYTAGNPLLITASNCTTPDGGQCMPNYMAGFTGPVRINGSWGHGALAGKTSPSYIAGSGVAFADPAPYTIGNVARTGAYGLRGPGVYDISMSVKRSFPLYENVRLLFDAEGYNLTNKVLFGISSTNVDSGSFGQISGQSNTSRDIQLALRIDF